MLLRRFQSLSVKVFPLLVTWRRCKVEWQMACSSEDRGILAGVTTREGCPVVRRTVTFVAQASEALAISSRKTDLGKSLSAKGVLQKFAQRNTSSLTTR